MNTELIVRSLGFTRALGYAARDWGLQPLDAELLGAIVASPGILSGDLAATVGVANLSQQRRGTSSLAGAGLIIQHQDAATKQSSFAATPAGLERWRLIVETARAARNGKGTL